MINVMKQSPIAGKIRLEGRCVNRDPNTPNLSILFSRFESIPKKGINVPIFKASQMAERILRAKRITI